MGRVEAEIGKLIDHACPLSPTLLFRTIQSTSAPRQSDFTGRRPRIAHDPLAARRVGDTQIQTWRPAMNSLNHKSNSKLIATLAGALWLTGQASFTLADPPKGPPPVEKSTTVRFADLNLESPEGAHALYSRIRSAAESLCGEQFSLWDGNRSREWQDCYRTTIERAVVQ